MNMCDEERDYIIEQLDELIKLAKHVGMAALGSIEDYQIASIALNKQRSRVLSMDGIEE